MSAQALSIRTTGALACAFLALIWLLPFSLPDHKVPIGTFWQEWMAVSLLATAIILRLARTSDSARIGIAPVTMALVGPAAVITVQFVSGLLNFPSNLIIPLLYASAAIAACVLGSTLRQNGQLEHLSSWIALACVIGGMFNVSVQLAQLLAVERHFPFMSFLIPGQRPFGNINQSNHLASYLGLAASSVLYLHSSGRLSRISTTLVVLALATGLALTGQRSALVYALIPLTLTLLGWRSLPAARSDLLRLCLALPLLLIAINLLIPLLTQHTSLQGTVMPLEALQSKSFYDDRENLWEHSWGMFKAHPLLGVGFDQYWSEFFEQLDTLYGALAPSHPHNLLAALLAETGLAGTLLVVLPLGFWLRRTRLKADSWPQWLGLSQIVIIGFHSLIEYPLWYSYFLVILAFWFGACDPAVWTFRLPWPRRAALLLCLLTLPALADIAMTYQKFRAAIWSMPHANITGLPAFVPTPQPQTMIELSDHWFFQREVLFWLPDVADVSLDKIELKLELNQRAMKVAPSSTILFRQVLLRVLNGQPEEAARLLRRAKQIYPERYRLMQMALPLAEKKWPDQFGPVMPLLLESAAVSQDASAGPRSR